MDSWPASRAANRADVADITSATLLYRLSTSLGAEGASNEHKDGSNKWDSPKQKSTSRKSMNCDPGSGILIRASAAQGLQWVEQLNFAGAAHFPIFCMKPVFEARPYPESVVGNAHD